MKTKKSTQIFLAFLSSVGLWVFGHLLSGRLSFVKDIVIFPAGPLVLIFPFVFIVACILVAKHSAKTGKDIYYKSSIVFFAMPAVCWIMSQLFSFIFELNIPIISSIADILVVVFMLPSIGMFSIYVQTSNVLGINTYGMQSVLLSVIFFIPIVTGILYSIKVYKDTLKFNT